MRNCGNCEYSYKDEDFENIIEDEEFLENTPTVGTCCLSLSPDENGICNSHAFVEGMEEYDNYILYDDKFFGPGYIIVSKLDNEIVRFVKISLFAEMGFGNFIIIGYEKGKTDNQNNEFTEINFKAKINEPLYDVLSAFAKKLNGQTVYSVDKMTEGRNNISVSVSGKIALLKLRKDIYGVKHNTNYINVFLGDNDTCPQYFELMEFYHNLSTHTEGKMNEDDVLKLLKIK